MVLINIYVNIPLYLLSQFDVSSRIYENSLKCSLRGEHVLRENKEPWPCHGCTPPWPWGHGWAKRCSGKRGMGSKTCRLPMVGHKQRIGVQGSARACARQCMGAGKAAHKRAQGSAQAAQGSTTVAHRRMQAAQGNTQATHRQLQGQRLNSVQATSRQCMPATWTLANDGTWLGLRWGALKGP